MKYKELLRNGKECLFRGENETSVFYILQSRYTKADKYFVWMVQADEMMFVGSFRSFDEVTTNCTEKTKPE